MDPSYAPPQQKQGWKGWQKALLGVGIGCGLLFIGSVGACFMGVVWLTSTGDQLPLEPVVGEQSVGVFGSRNRNRDEGVVEMVDFLSAELQRQTSRIQGGNQPGILGWLENNPFMQAQRQGQYHQFIPKEITVTLEPAADGEQLDWLVAANLPTMPRMLPMMFSFMANQDAGGSDMYKYRGRTILDDGDGVALCFASGTVLVGRTASDIELFLDRVEQPGGRQPEAIDLAVEARELALHWDLYGVLTDENGALVEVLERMDRNPGPEWDTVEKMVLGVDIVGSDRVDAEIRLTIQDLEDRRRMVELYQQEDVGPGEEQLLKGLTIEQMAVTEGEEVVVALKFTGVRFAVRSWFDELVEPFPERPED
jgi:hypothetical protein